MAYIFPEFGCAGQDTKNRTRSANLLDFYDGVGMYQLIKSHSGSVSYTFTDIERWGIQEHVGSDAIFDGSVIESVTLTETEEGIQHEKGIPTTGAEEGDKTILTYVDKQYVMRVKKTVSVSGFGKSTKFTQEDLGGTFNIVVDSAIGAVGGSEIISITGMVLTSINYEKSNTDWAKFTAEFSKVVPNVTPFETAVGDTAGFPIVLSSTEMSVFEDVAGNGTIGGDDTPYRIVTRTTNMRQDGFVTKDYSIEFHFGLKDTTTNESPIHDTWTT